MDAIIRTLQADYARFPENPTLEIYAENVFFKDPMTEFRGRDRYTQMIQFIQRFFLDCQMEVHGIEAQGSEGRDRQIRSDWTLHWTTPLPWRPRISIAGWSELTVNEAGLIDSHIDYWHCSRWDVLKQHFPRR